MGLDEVIETYRNQCCSKVLHNDVTVLQGSTVHLLFQDERNEQ